MSQVYNPEAGLMEQIERLALEARDFYRRMKNVRRDDDRRVMGEQLADIEARIQVLQTRLPH
jgi:hypothetical protein